MSLSLQLYTIGFTRKSAESFFTLLAEQGVRRVVDVRLRNNSQLSGFAKQRDLAYFLKAIAGIEYVPLLELAPTAEILDPYKKRTLSWAQYSQSFLELMEERKIESSLDPALLNESCLLCSEHEPQHCHRRLVADYLQQRWTQQGVELSVRHLL